MRRNHWMMSTSSEWKWIETRVRIWEEHQDPSLDVIVAFLFFSSMLEMWRRNLKNQVESEENLRRMSATRRRKEMSKVYFSPSYSMKHPLDEKIINLRSIDLYCSVFFLILCLPVFSFLFLSLSLCSRLVSRFILVLTKYILSRCLHRSSQIIDR